jgi:hypothetical protein
MVYIGMFVRNDGALTAVKKLYICLSAARDIMYRRSLLAKVIHNGTLSTLIRVQRLKQYGSAVVRIVDVIVEIHPSTSGAEPVVVYQGAGV